MLTIQFLLRSIFIQSWWVIAFLLLCTIMYEEGLRKRDHVFQQLTQQRIDLLQEKEAALQRQQNLQLQINSQSDISWIELTLMKGLGLVPEGQQKVYFFQNNTLNQPGEQE